MRDRAFDELWDESPGAADVRFDPVRIADWPQPARQYLAHAVAPGALIAAAVRLRMHGEIKLKNEWHPFEADQVIRWPRGFVWRARVKMKGLPVTGSDRWIDGKGSMRWKMLGLVPVMMADGPDISRAALGRVEIESIWLPTVLLGPGVAWTATDSTHVTADLPHGDHTAHLDLGVDATGGVSTACIMRWGNPDEKKGFQIYPFGGIISDEKSFDGITIPSAMRVGWYFGSDRFETEGEFFRVTVDHAEFR